MSDELTRLGIILFPGFALLDVAGPMQFFNQLSAIRPLELSVIAKTMDPVNTAPPASLYADQKFPSIGEAWLPTHTFDNAPDVDVLLVPGGRGTRDETIFNDITAFVKSRYAKLRYLLSVCTGSLMLAGSGVLDGRRATSNKFAWNLTERFPAVAWVPKARWVVDGNIWSSSGVAAGMDMTYAFISTVYSPEIAKQLADVMEYEPHTDPDWDPFSAVWKVSS